MITLEEHGVLTKKINNHRGGKDSTTRLEIVQSMNDCVDENFWADTKGTYFDPAAGSGTFLVDAYWRMIKTGDVHDNIINNRLYACEINVLSLRVLRDKLGIKNIYDKDFLQLDLDMEFDYQVYNPPYNKRKDSGGVAGTIGDKTFYRKFVDKGFELLKPNGKLVCVTLKNITSHLDKLDKQIDVINLMTEKDYWKYDTLFFVATNKKREKPFIVEDYIIKNLYTHSNEWNLCMQSKSLMQLQRDYGVKTSNNGKVLLKLNGSSNEIYGDLPSNLSPITGPKFMFAMLESLPSYTVTDKDAYPHCSSYVKVDTLEEAEKLKLFVTNNKAYKFFTSKMKLKSHSGGLRKLKRFDLLQIKTGFEYPSEFNLSNDDIKFIEATVG